MRLSAHGITTDLPFGWEGRITKRAAPGSQFDADEGRGHPGEATFPVVHLANFALPELRGDFGSGAVDVMGPSHVLVTLFEYGPESVGQALFASRGIPRLSPRMFDRAALQRTLPGQAGCQRFFTQTGRAFCLYVVLGRHTEASALVAKANATLSATTIGTR